MTQGDPLRRSASTADADPGSPRPGLHSSLAQGDRAAQIVWTLTSPEVHVLMRDTGHRSQSAYQEWLEQAITDGILGSS